MQGQDAVFILSLDAAFVHGFGKCETPDKASVRALDPMKPPPLLFFFLSAFPLQGQHTILYRHLHVFFSHFGQLGFDQVL